MLKKIKNWIMWKISNIRLGIKKWSYFLPVIWRDRQWDESFFFRILEVKLKLMEDYFKNYGISVDAEKDAHNIEICRNLCKRLHEQDYTNPYEKRNKLVLSRPLTTEPIKNKEGKTVAERIVFHDTESERKYFLLADDHEQYLEKQDIEYLCKILQKHVRGWWD